MTQQNHIVDSEGAKFVDRRSGWRTRGIKEAIWIRKTKDSMNEMRADADSHISVMIWRATQGAAAGGAHTRVIRLHRMTTLECRIASLYVYLFDKKCHYAIIKFKHLCQPIFSDNCDKLCRAYFLGEQSLSLPIACSNQSSTERFTARAKITCSQL